MTDRSPYDRFFARADERHENIREVLAEMGGDDG